VLYGRGIATSSPASLPLSVGARSSVSVGDDGLGPVPIRRVGGLGRKLSGILSDSLGADDVPWSGGLQQLLGPGRAVAPQVRQFVTDTAMGVLAEVFDAEAVVIARHDDRGLVPSLSSRIPRAWNDRSGVVFELHGQLWGLLNELSSRVAEESVVERVVAVDGDHLEAWVGGQSGAHGRIAAAVVRERPFDVAERVALRRLLRSVAAATGSESGCRVLASVGVQVEGTPNGSQATVSAKLGGVCCQATAVASTADLAVAQATCGLLQRSPLMMPPGLRVDFAGSATVDDSNVTIVLVDDGGVAPLIGLGVATGGGHVGVVEAVMSALSASDSSNNS